MEQYTMLQLKEPIEVTHLSFQPIGCLKSMFRLRRNRVVDLHKQKLETVPEWNFM